jgi:regulatory protein
VPTITAIKPQKTRPRVNVYVDNKFGFGLDLENYVKLSLKVGQEYTSEKINEIVRHAEFSKVTEKIINYAMVRPRSEKEINDWFRRKKVHESLFDDLKETLRKLELLDDRKFAHWWIDQRNTFRPRGLRALKAELRQKGINQMVVEEVLSNTPIDEVAIAKNIYKKAKYKWERYDSEIHRKKASEYLARKGFSWEVIKQIVKANDEI